MRVLENNTTRVAGHVDEEEQTLIACVRETHVKTCNGFV